MRENAMLDRRVIKTRTNIKHAFMQLAMDKQYNKITIKDITEQAKVNRTTFYLHYDGVEAVILDIEKDFKKEIDECISDIDSNNIYDSLFQNFSKLTKILNTTPNTKEFILNSTYSNNMLARLKEILVERSIQTILAEYAYADVEKIKIHLTFAVAGIVDCYVKWEADRMNRLNYFVFMNMLSLVTTQVLENMKLALSIPAV
jgi:AcrR family transcriptional regulator